MKTGNPDVQQTQNQNQNTLLIPKKIMWSQLLQNNKKSNYLNWNNTVYCKAEKYSKRALINRNGSIS